MSRGSWVSWVGCLVSRVYLGLLFGLSAWAIAPVLAGWSVYTDPTGSAESSLVRAGDIVVVSPVDADTVRAGSVVVRGDSAGALRLERLIDAEATDVVGVARFEVPLIGLPDYWWRHGQPGLTLSWLVMTVLAAISALTPGSARRHLVAPSGASAADPVLTAVESTGVQTA